MAAKRIVIIEDHPATLDGLSARLGQESDIDLVGAYSTMEEAAAKVSDLNPDAILLDLHLPDAAGPKSSIARLRQLAPAARLVVYSGETRSAFVQAAMKAGANAYLLKNETAARVAEVIRLVLAGNGQIISAAISRSHIKLTDTEKELLEGLARGMKYHDIASKRYTSWETVRKQCEKLQEKLALSTREELIAWAAASGFAETER